MTLNGVSVARRTPGEPGLAQHDAEVEFTGLRTEPHADLLRQRRQRADHGRQAVEIRPDRVQVVRQPVTR
jgi:hypothetical protein